MNHLRNSFSKLLEAAKILGLSKTDLDSSSDLLKNHEFGLCLDTVATQLYENNIEISNDFYLLVKKIAFKLSLPNEVYSFLKELIREESKISKEDFDQLTRILDIQH